MALTVIVQFSVLSIAMWWLWRKSRVSLQSRASARVGSTGSVSDNHDLLGTKSSGDEDRYATLRILVFHLQLLALVVSTGAGRSLPEWLAGPMISVSDASSFQLSSLLAPECYVKAGLHKQLWLTAAMPVIVAILCGAVAFVVDRVSRRPDPLRRERGASLALAALNLLYLPVAQISLSALGCFDTRQSKIGGSRFLNRYLYIACDEKWARTTVFPAVLCVLWVTVLPVVVSVFSVRARRDAQRQFNRLDYMNEVHFADVLHVQLFDSYKDQLWW
jgi:hypothetical protein